MEKDAIQQIQDSAHIPEMMQELAKFNTADPVITLPENMKVHDLEKYMPNRSSYRQEYSTHSIEDFGKYCLEFDQPGAKCFVDQDAMSAKAILDLGTELAPGHQRHRAIINLKKNAPFKALLAMNGERLSQRQASDFIEDWADFFTGVKTTEDTDMTPNAAAQSLQNLTIEAAKEVNSKVSDFGESMSSLEKVEAKNQSALPAYLMFNCQPYFGLSARNFVVRVQILTSGDRPQISLRIVQLEAQKERMANEFKENLCAQFSADKISIETFMGSV